MSANNAGSAPSGVTRTPFSTRKRVSGIGMVSAGALTCRAQPAASRVASAIASSRETRISA